MLTAEAFLGVSVVRLSAGDQCMNPQNRWGGKNDNNKQN